MNANIALHRDPLNKKFLIAALTCLSAAVLPLYAADIHDAAIQADPNTIESLLAHQPDLVTATDISGATALHIAVLQGPKQAVDILL
ncbi:MAG: ankyrin repeat domain-containing protein, partial [Planctomycetota bacterium]